MLFILQLTWHCFSAFRSLTRITWGIRPRRRCPRGHVKARKNGNAPRLRTWQGTRSAWSEDVGGLSRFHRVVDVREAT